jgi:hypothetical protein
MTKVDDILLNLMQELGVKASLEEFKMGIEIEKEHTLLGIKEGRYAVVPLKLLPLAKIAAAHLAELPDYYTRLKKMEDNKTANVKPRNLILDALGLHAVNKLIDIWGDKEDKIPEKQKQKKPIPESEEIDDDFFASQSDEAINPDDIVQKPKQPNFKAAKNPEYHKLTALQEQMHETLHYVVNKLIPEAKGNVDKFNSLRELKETLETSLLTVEDTILKFK